MSGPSYKAVKITDQENFDRALLELEKADEPWSYLPNGIFIITPSMMRHFKKLGINYTKQEVIVGVPPEIRKSGICTYLPRIGN